MMHKREGDNLIKERLTVTNTYRYVRRFLFTCKLLDNYRDTYRPPDH